MQLRESKGRMFTSVDWTATYYQGCDHDCIVCFTKFLPWGPINHKPKLLQTNEHQIIKGKKGVVFLNSAHDSFATCIPDEWILAMLRWIGRQHEDLIVYLQSQNVERALEFLPQLKEIQNHVIIGTTIQTDSELIIKKMSRAPSILSRYQAILKFRLDGFRVRLSLEPLFRFNLANMVAMVRDINPELVEVGLDNYAYRHKLEIPQPRLGAYQVLKIRLQNHGIKVIEKDSIKKWRNREESK